MSGDPGERHARLVHFLANGCTKLTRALIGKLVENAKPADAVGANKPWTLDDFLYDRKSQIPKTKNEARYKKLFPGRLEETKIEDWDLSLLCFVVSHCADDWLIKQDIKKLLSIRNKVYHSANATIEKVQFDHFINVIEVIVERCCKFIDKQAFTQEIQGFLDKCKKENIGGYNEDMKVVQEWYESDPIAELNRKVDGLSNDHQKMLDKLDEMMSLLKTNGISGVTLPDTNVELIVKNCSRDKELVISEYLLKLLIPKMSKDLPNLTASDKDKVMNAVKESMSELLKGDREIVKIYHGCINLRIRCSSFDSLRDLWIYCIDGRLTKAFQAVREHLRVFSECPNLELDVGITHFEFNRCLEATVMEIAKLVNRSSGQEVANDDRTDSALGSNTLANAEIARMTDDSFEATRSDDGSVVVLNVQPSSFNQAENIWETCRSGAFNEKLKGLSKVLQEVYGYEDLSISARLENDSPYDTLFQYRNTGTPYLEYGKETSPGQNDGRVTQELETYEDILEDAGTARFDPAEQTKRIHLQNHLELSTIPNPKLVVALDIGCTYSGYAWMWRSDGDIKLSSVEYNTNWGVGALQLYKTSTSLLLNENEEVDSFGHLAERRYCVKEDTTKWYLFERFKQILYTQKSLDHLKVDAMNGSVFSLKDVMSKFIGALKNDFLKKMKERELTIDVQKTLWVITVPAIWDENARSFMQNAAIKAGISRYNLLIALEPEVASIYCLHKMPQVGYFAEASSKYVIMDLGGGTVDMTAFEVLEDGYLRETCIGHGGCVGGQDINNAFLQRWKDAFNERDWENVREHHTDEELVKMRNDFERGKVEIGSSEDVDTHISLNIPENTKKLLSSGIIRLKDSGESSNIFKMDRGQFWFSSEMVRNDLFQVTIRRIVDIIKAFFNDHGLCNVSTVVLVGGFAESKIVRDEIKKGLQKIYPNLKFVTPSSPFCAVLAGAVLYGHNPRIYRSRISRKTYGIRTSAYFDPEKHNEKDAYLDPRDGERYIRGVFNIHVRKGDEVSLNNELTPVMYYPKREDARKVRIRIYSSDDRDPQRVTEEGCREEGEIVFDLSELDIEDQEIAVRMVYGGTQIEVKAEEVATHETRSATIKFK